MTLPIINLSLLPSFPAVVVGDGPIVITKAGLTYTFALDISQYSVNPAPGADSISLLGYNATQGITERYGAAAGRDVLGLGNVATLNAGDGLAVDSGDLRLATTGVTAGTYNATTVTTDIYGRITEIASGVPPTGKTLVKIDILTTSGTWSRPTGATSAEVFLWAGGGSGASSQSPSASQGSGGSGGGGGGFSYRYITALPNATESYTVGTGGAAPAAASNGNAGGSSSFGTSPYLSATGGGGGTYSASTANNFAAGGVGGVGSGGSYDAAGAAGGPLNIATAAGANYRQSGAGGSSPSGGHGGAPVIGGTGTNGNAGVGPGAGGSGALSFNAGSAALGGAGANGLIIVKSYG